MLGQKVKEVDCNRNGKRLKSAPPNEYSNQLTRGTHCQWISWGQGISEIMQGLDANVNHENIKLLEFQKHWKGTGNKSLYW